MKIKPYLCTMFRYHTYGKSELAQLYCPHLTTSAARRKLMSWIARQPQLIDELHRSGFTPNTHTFTPYQVRLIVDALGEP